MATQPKINQMFKAFADETRLRILHLLSRGELCVCDIMAALELPQSKISRHLAYLKHAGLVRDRRAGLWKYYTLESPRAAFHRGLVDCLRGCFGDVDLLKKDRRMLKLLKRRKRC